MKYLISLVATLLISLMLNGQVSSEFYSQNQKSINVIPNKNLEVLFTIYNQIWTPFLDENATNEILANTQLMKSNYTFFREFRDHKAIRMTRDFMNRSGTDFFLYAFYFDDFPKAKRIREIPNLLLKDINPSQSTAQNEIDSLMTEISRFYELSNFENFYKKNEHVYQIAIEEVSKNIPDNNFISFIETYFGQEYRSYNFIVIPFFKTEFGMAHQIQTENGVDNVTFISPFEPAQMDKENRIEYTGYDSEKDILAWIVHEYSHVFFNSSLTETKNLDMLNEFEYLFKPIRDNPQIGNWFSVFAEHIAVAFEVRAAHLLGDEDRSGAILKTHNDWYYLDHFVSQLTYYENNRDIYPDIDSFMPILIRSCKDLK